VAGFLLRVGIRLDTLWERILGNSGPRWIVIFVADDGPRSVAMADQVGRSHPAVPRLIVSWRQLDEKRFRDAREFMILDSSRTWSSWTALRRRLLQRRIELVVFELTPSAPAAWRWLPAALACPRLLVFNADGESHCINEYIAARHPIAAWRFLRGAPAADIYRPTPFAFLREWLQWLRVAALLALWRLRRGRPARAELTGGAGLRPAQNKPAEQPAREGCAVLCPADSDAAHFDRQVSQCDAAELVVTPEPLLPDSETVAALRRLLQQPGVWLVCGRAGFKRVLGEGWAPHRPGENGTFCLGAASPLFAFRRDVFVELGGLAAFENLLPGQGWAALSLRAWLRGHATIYAGGIDSPSIQPPAPPVQTVEGPPLAQLLPVCDSVAAAARLLHRHARTPEFREAYRAAVRRLRLPPGNGPRLPSGNRRPRARLAPLAEPGSMILEGREPRKPLRLAVLAAELPHPAAGRDAARAHHLLRRLAGHCDLFLFCYAQWSAGSQFDALLDCCAQLVLIQPQTAPAAPRGLPDNPAAPRGLPDTPAVPRGLPDTPAAPGGPPADAAQFDTVLMRRHLEFLLDAWRIPLLQVEGARLAMAGSWLRSAATSTSTATATATATVLAAPELRFAFPLQMRGSPMLPAAARWRREAAAWRRYELRHLRDFDCIITAGAPDRERLAQQVSGPLLRTVASGVDAGHFRGAAADPGENNILFAGGLDDFVNIAALHVLLETIWPRIRQAQPAARLTVVAGADYRLHWRRCYRRSLPEAPDVQLLGRVGDLRPLYERASVVLAPLAAGGGVSPRVLEALAMSRAVVATPPACEGLALEPGRHLLVEAEPNAFAAAVLRLLADETLRRELGRHGRAAVESGYGWDRAAAQQLEIYDELLRAKK
jgi:Glycosyl transferases group 1